jgi:sigma-E factor negative regulatory protein RseB
MKSNWTVVCFVFLAAQPALADKGDPQEALAWLSKIAGASAQQNYSGTFIYQHRGVSETSRIVHFVNTAGGVFEKLEALDGPAREVIRSNDQVTCYLPTIKTVIIEQRNARLLPAQLPERLTDLAESYEIRTGRLDRVAGYECRVIILEPRDNLRYGRRFCAETRTGLPLRASTIGEKNEILELFAFTELAIGGDFNRDKVKSKYATDSRSWRIDRSALNVKERTVDTGWVIRNEPAGFRKLMEIKRSIAGRGTSVAHIVYSDGLAAVSIFIEPLTSSSRDRPEQSLTHQGAVNIYTRQLAGHLVTVLGETPTTTVMQIANSLEHRAAASR